MPRIYLVAKYFRIGILGKFLDSKLKCLQHNKHTMIYVKFQSLQLFKQGGKTKNYIIKKMFCTLDLYNVNILS